MVSNLVVVAIVLGGVAVGFALRRNRLWREAGRALVRRRPLAIAVVALYVLVALADSIYWRGGELEGADVVSQHEAMSLVDRAFFGTAEASYSAPLADVEFYAERLVNPFDPRAVVVFAGTNDLQPGASKSPEVLLETYRRFVERVRADLPKVSIYFIGVTPSPRRWEIWDQAQETNRLVREWSARDPTLFYIETGPALLGEGGEPDADNYMFDGLHLSAQGYAIWTDIIRTRLMEDLQGAPTS